MKKLHFIIFFLLLQTMFGQESFIESKLTAGYKGDFIPELKNENEDLNFLVLGDFGRVGEYYQKEVAKQLGNAALMLDSEFIVTVGDNFYPNGVASIYDEHWHASFNNIYKHPSLYIDWYAALGNHDHRGNIDAQIAYSDISRRWNMPAPYYSKTFELNDGKKLLLVVMDTSPFIQSYQGKTEKYPHLESQNAEEQKKWLIETLSTNDESIAWKVVVGHHPLYSGGKRKEAKDTKDFESQFADLFDSLEVDAYICGHEHDLQIIKPKGRFTTQFLSGGGSETRPAGTREGTIFSKAEPGFMSFTVNGDSIEIKTIKAHENSAEILHTMHLKKK